MKYLISLLTSLFLFGCSNNPIVVPDPTKDNVVILELKDRITQPGGVQPTYGWLFWYGPLCILLLMWGYRTLIRKPINCIEEEPQEAKVTDKVKKVEVDGVPGD